jgi:hypothetical protein
MGHLAAMEANRSGERSLGEAQLLSSGLGGEAPGLESGGRGYQAAADPAARRNRSPSCRAASAGVGRCVATDVEAEPSHQLDCRQHPVPATPEIPQRYRRSIVNATLTRSQ